MSTKTAPKAAATAPQAATVAAPTYTIAPMGAAVTAVVLTALGAGMATAATAPSTAQGAAMLPRLAWAVGQALAKAGKPVAAGQVASVAQVQPYLAAMRLNAGHLQGSGVANSPKHAQGRASHKAAHGTLATCALPLISVQGG